MSLSKCYSSLLDSMNAEIRIRWLQIVVRNDYYPDLHRVRRFLESQVTTTCTSPAPTAPPSPPLPPHRLGTQENGGGGRAGSRLPLGGAHQVGGAGPCQSSGRPCPPEGKLGARSGGLGPHGPGPVGSPTPGLAPGLSEGPRPCYRGSSLPTAHGCPPSVPLSPSSLGTRPPQKAHSGVWVERPWAA